MTFIESLAGVLVSLGPLLVIFWAFLRPRPPYIIMAIVASFFWLCGAILASILWRLLFFLAFIPLFPVFLLNAMTASARVLLIMLWFYLQRNHRRLLPEYANLPVALSIGWGFAMTQTLITQSALWADALGPGTLMSVSCASFSLVALSALLSSIFSLLQITVTVLFFDGYFRKCGIRCTLAILIYFLASLSTVINTIPGISLCIIPLLISAALLALGAALTYVGVIRCPPPTDLSSQGWSWELLPFLRSLRALLTNEELGT